MEHSYKSDRSIHRRFTFSCDTFGGYSIDVDVNKFDSIQSIINHAVDCLKEQLRWNGFTSLLEKLQTLSPLYHIHDYDFGNIIMEERIYYICNHGCNTSNKQ